MNLLTWIDKRKHWWKVFLLIFAVSTAVVGYIGVKTYEFAPPLADFRSEDGRLLFRGEAITAGQQVFFEHGLMDYGSFLGDGGLRGPDYTAEALHRTAQWMRADYDRLWRQRIPDPKERAAFVDGLVRTELKRDSYDPETNTVTLSKVHAAAFDRLVQYYGEVFGRGGKLAGAEAFRPAGYIEDPKELRDLAAFFFWGGWLSAAERPGQGVSYTQNWPYEPLAGNTPPGGVVMWSVIGVLALILSLGVVFYFYGKLDREAVLEAQRAKLPPLAENSEVDRFEPTPTQRACYKFFAVAALLFAFQVLAGLLTIADFLGLTQAVGLDRLLPVTATRAWHTQVAILWIAVCWFAGSIWVLPLICRPEPRGQLRLVNLLFWMLVFVAAGAAVGIPLGIGGALGEGWRWLGLQGWEFMQIGRLFHIVLYAGFLLWLVIVVRGLWPVLVKRQTWSLPNWMVYAIAGIIFMFSASFVARPNTNFVIADFWRWCTIHMWVEAFFEVFTTILAAYFLYLMGFVSHAVAARVVYLAAILFLGSGLIGISHNFYWNAKSMETIALGGVLSSLQVTPLILLTVEAWRFRKLPGFTAERVRRERGSAGAFGLAEAFLFLVGVNFWNFMGAGVFGFMINLPIVNYYQHGTYLTVNHGHAALFGVYGNLAIATMLFCARWLLKPESWDPKPVRRAFWALNVGLALMVVFDLFPVGVYQLQDVMANGYAHARAQAFIHGGTFQAYTWLRGLGVAVFVLGGVIPIVWFFVSRWGSLKDAAPAAETLAVPPTVLAVADARAGARALQDLDVDPDLHRD